MAIRKRRAILRVLSWDSPGDKDLQVPEHSGGTDLGLSCVVLGIRKGRQDARADGWHDIGPELPNDNA